MRGTPLVPGDGGPAAAPAVRRTGKTARARAGGGKPLAPRVCWAVPISGQARGRRSSADFEAGRSAEAASHLMSALCAASNAWNATWAGAVRIPESDPNDPLQGWRVAAMQALHPIAPHRDEQHFRTILDAWERRQIDPSFLLPLRNVGRFRSYSFRRELPAAWFETPFYHQHYGAVGTFDAVFVAFPINDDCESHFGFYSARTFTDGEIRLLELALRGLKWFHRQLMLNHGLVMASAPLTATERRVLHMLLSRAPEKEFGSHLDMAPSTAHQHVTRIYRKFGVRSRAELMSLWLSAA